MIGLDTKQINDVVVAWLFYWNRRRKMKSHAWISLQGDSTLAKAEEVRFTFSTGATFLVSKFPLRIAT